jgi:hypothetical protein
VKKKLRALLQGRIRPVMITVALIAALLVIGARLVDEGEVVMLTTVDSRGRDQVTELWIVALPSGTYLRAGSPDVAWLARLRDHPKIKLERGDEVTYFVAVPEAGDAIRTQVNEAMNSKYGFANELWGRFSDRGSAIPIRLDPAAVAAP